MLVVKTCRNICSIRAQNLCIVNNRRWEPEANKKQGKGKECHDLTPTGATAPVLWSGWELLQSGAAPSTETMNKGKIKSTLNCFPELECTTLFFCLFLECVCSILKCQLSLTSYKSLERCKVLGPGNGSNVVIAVCFSREADVELVSRGALPNVKETGKF